MFGSRGAPQQRLRTELRQLARYRAAGQVLTLFAGQHISSKITHKPSVWTSGMIMKRNETLTVADTLSSAPPQKNADLLSELVAHLRRNRTQLREEWATRIRDAKLLTA